jgi:hypothetical protein
MKMERKLSDFFAEKWKRNENIETKMEICRMETETVFFGGNGTVISGGTDVEMEVSVSN